MLRQSSEGDDERVEMRLLSDEDYAAELEIAENELIDDHVRGALTGEEREQAERHFLRAPERQEKLAFATALAEEVAERGRAKPLPFVPPPARPRPGFFSSVYLKVAATVVLAVGVGLAVWSLLRRPSEIDQGMAALNEAYREQRPLEARITDMSYARAASTRGGAPDKLDYDARERAELILGNAARSGRPAALHALGRVYLASRQYDQAIYKFETALRSAPDDALLHTDLGAALLERGNHESVGAPDGQSSIDFARSLEHLNRALALNSALPDALFNRALLYQSMGATRQAVEDWRRYLELDPGSPWADEARRNLKLLEEQTGASRSAPREWEQFLDAYRSRDDARAWEALRSSREMITGRMIAFHLARDTLEAGAAGRDADSRELLDALAYAGALERERAGDPFVAELARFYAAAGRDARSRLAEAHAELAEGYRLCQSGRYGAAYDHFARARSLFETSGDGGEARVAEYWLAYSLGNDDRLSDSAALLDDLAKFCRRRGYRWLLSQALRQSANCYGLSGDHSRSLDLERQALEIASDIGDTYTQQKVLDEFAIQYTELGRLDLALAYCQRAMALAAAFPPGPRQDWRNFNYAAQTFYAMKHYDAALAYEREALLVVRDEQRAADLAYDSYAHLGMILAATGRYDEASKQAEAGLTLARSLADDPSSRKMIAYSLLQLAHIKRRAGDCADALAHYDESLSLYDHMEIEKLDGYDLHKGRLLCYLKQGDAAAEGELALTLELFEHDRAKIIEGQDRKEFFDAGLDIYDIAVGHALARGDKARAFDYSERSHARSLLDRLSRNPDAEPAAEPAAEPNATPFDYEAVKSRLRPGMQIVQYHALPDRLLIWVVSAARFEMFDRPVGAAELDARVRDYVSLLTSDEREARADELRRRAQSLYELLFAPVAPLLDPAREVCVIPDKALFHLPFAALVSPGGRYLVEDFTLLFSPSASVLLERTGAASGHARDRSGESLLSVGNPAFDRTAYPQLENLPYAEVEARKIAKLYGDQPALTGTGARKDMLMRVLEAADVIHFAGHYVADERTPARSRLLLAAGGGDGALTAADVSGLHLQRAPLVVLAACDTELEGKSSGEGVTGMARAFLAAGAPLVVASQWPVDSDAAADLMIRFHRLRRLEGKTTTAALRLAQQEMLLSDRYRSPYYWAAFLPVGGHADY